ncbi:hypothetical protein LSH36_258g05055 [Paralvinella palmiformis]|uniref:Homeobox domain-containing protein n=1 Tax=Paralvinella palmiformis TaxID=53620 RepID=A0AAD9N4I8_9ANNE|nr:hypothetical protein LSH36_258g05055 [Paralvinella palmiformis]
MTSTTDTRVFSVSPIISATGDPHSNMNLVGNMNDSGIGSESDSPFSSIAQTTVTSVTLDEPGRMGLGLVPSIGETVPSCDAILEPSNTIQQAFFMAESSLHDVQHNDDASRSRISSSSSEESVDAEKTFNMVMSPQFDPDRQVEDKRPTPQLQQLETLDPAVFQETVTSWPAPEYGLMANSGTNSSTSCGEEIVSGEANSDITWISKQASQHPGQKCLQSIPNSGQSQNVFYPCSQSSPVELMKLEKELVGCSTPQNVGCSSVQASSHGSLLHASMGQVPYHCGVPVMSCSEQMNPPKMLTFDPLMITADPLLQHQEKEIHMKLVQASVHPVVQANVMELWRAYRHRTSQTGRDVFSLCSSQPTGPALTSCLTRFFKAQHCLAGEFIIALLDEILVRNTFLPFAQAHFDGNPPHHVVSYGTPTYNGYGYSPQHPPPYQQCLRVPAATLDSQVPRLHIISPTDVSNGQSSYNYNGPSSTDCQFNKENQCYNMSYPKYLNPVHANGHHCGPDYFGPFVKDLSSNCDQMTVGARHAAIPAADQEISMLKCSPCSPGRGNRKLKAEATDIMNRWYYEHLIHPYPNPETTERLAEACHITVDQVKKWFANKRMRTRNTKSLREIALARRKLENDTLALISQSQHVAVTGC